MSNRVFRVIEQVFLSALALAIFLSFFVFIARNLKLKYMIPFVGLKYAYDDAKLITDDERRYNTKATGYICQLFIPAGILAFICSLFLD